MNNSKRKRIKLNEEGRGKEKKAKKDASKIQKDKELEDLRAQRDSDIGDVNNMVESADLVDDIPDMLDFLEVTSGLVAGGGAPGLDTLMSGVFENDFVTGEIAQETAESACDEDRRVSRDLKTKKMRDRDETYERDKDERHQDEDVFSPEINFRKRK